MKYLLVLALLAVGLWKWRQGRQNDRAHAAQTRHPGPGNTAPQALVACAHCGVRVPRSEALSGLPDQGGAQFCCPEHRTLGPVRKPAP